MTTPHLVNDHNHLIDEAKLRAAELHPRQLRRATQDRFFSCLSGFDAQNRTGG